MRILHVETRHRRGGAERNLANTIAWELSHGHEVHLAVGRDSLDGEFPPGAVAHVIPELVRSVSPVHDVRALLALRRLIGDGRFDVVHTHQSKAGVLGRLAARNRVPVILHTIHMASFGPAYNSLASIGFAIAERRCASFTTRIVSVGRELVDMYRAAGIGSADRFVVIRSPIELSAYARLRDISPDERASARIGFGLRAEVPVALVVASLEPRKRVDLIVRSLAPSVAAGRVQLLIAGDGPERGLLQALVEELGVGDGVRFAGYVSDPTGVFAAATVLVHAATVEGVPQVVIQALAAGLPVAATEMVGLREVDDAQVELAHATGKDLVDACDRALRGPARQVPLDSLAPWAPDAVRRDLAALYRSLPQAGR